VVKDTQATTERVGRYQILDAIGNGPNGTVSRAKVFGVAGFERQFAVKRFLPELTMMSAQAQALSAAARSYGSLEHPRIARMSEFGVVQGATFTAVEYVVGLDAMRLLAETRVSGVALAIGGALALISQAARAVGYAHGRGLTHLGLAPTNVIVTIEGDVKVTDFGILAATMPARPLDTGRLANRIPYLAPEQLSGEATSAATDVFVLGVIAYELVTGHRVFRGDTPQQVAQAILAGPPPEPPLPRPIVRVLQRCLARSPFERFPDARALADALDAALRVAPVPGTRKDIGAQVKAIVDRLGELNEGNMSGMLSLDVGTGAKDYKREEMRTEPSPTVTAADLAAHAAASTIPELRQPPTTVPGVPPPPIPVPPGVSPGGAPPTPPSTMQTMLGLSPMKRPAMPAVIPTIKPRSSDGPKPPIPSIAKPEAPPPAPPPPSAPPPVAVTPPASRAAPVTMPPELEAALTEAIDDAEPMEPDTEPSPPEPSPPPSEDFAKREVPTSEISPVQLDQLNQVAAQRSQELPVVKPPEPEPPLPGFEVSPPQQQYEPPPPPMFETTPPPYEQPSYTPPPSYAPPPPPLAPSYAPPPYAPPPQQRLTTAPTAQRSRLPWVLFTVLLLGGIGAAGWFAYIKMNQHKTSSNVVKMGSGSAIAAAPADAAEVVAVGSSAPEVAPADAAVVANVADAAPPSIKPPPAPADAAVATPAGTSDSLQITSTPPGAHLYLNGADQGPTPVKLPGTADRHNVALLLAGHDLYVGEVDGHGQFNIELKPVTPAAGPAGIKVIKCKDKDRYYVFVDGKPTGMTCPTERINAGLGAHTVEVYDAVSESRQKWDINITDTRLSFRVRIDAQ
jgi:serine/threonine protein kinase